MLKVAHFWKQAMSSILLSDTLEVTVLCEAGIRSNRMFAWECNSVDSWADEKSGQMNDCIFSSLHADNRRLATLNG